MKKLPYGISNYEELILDNYYYVDKTDYIEKLEKLAEKRIMCLRPRKFGKTLFTSTLEFYYDINSKEKFENLFKDTYIGKNPTKLKNSYHILRFNFSGIDTSSEETTMKGFTNEVASSVKLFAERYGLDFYTNFEDMPENIINNLFKSFYVQKGSEKIYVIIDEYDHFANELLSFNTAKFKELVSRNGKVRKWYEILKKGTESIVDRIFITGVAPITLDSLTSGFNICSDITRDIDFNCMLGFTKQEVIDMMDELRIDKQEQEEILPILKENYDGYKFAKGMSERIYNSNMCLYLLKDYCRFKKLPDNLIDVNIASDYKKLSQMLKLCTGERRRAILEDTLSGEGVYEEIVDKFNPEKEFEEQEFISMLYYLGYLTVYDETISYTKLGIPNKVMRELYSEYFLDIIPKDFNFKTQISYPKIGMELALEGKIDRITEVVHTYLNNLSNRDYQRFDEKYVKLIFYCIVMNIRGYSVKSEYEVNRKYPDILVVPREKDKGYYGIMVEFKYLKAGEEDKIQKMQSEAKQQIEEYAEFEDIKNINNLRKYTVVAVNDKLYVEEV